MFRIQLHKDFAKNAFENMKKNYSKKKGNLKSAQSQSGNNREPVDKALVEYNKWKFCAWIDEFIQPRTSKSSVDNYSSQQYTYREEEEQSQIEEELPDEPVDPPNSLIDEESGGESDSERNSLEDSNFSMSPGLVPTIKNHANNQ